MRNRLWIVPLVALALAALACSGPSAGGGDTGGDNAPKVLYRETFDSPDSNWSTFTDNTASVEYRGGEFVIEIYEPEYLIWGVADDKSYSNIRLTATARNVGASGDAMFGFICNYQDADNFYYLGSGADGYFGISRYVDDVETELVEWDFSDQIATDQASYALQADCGGGQLVLYVDGKEVASTQDDSFSGGNVGLFALSFEGSAVEVRFDNLVVTELP